jgi:hypothetical protein
MLLFCPHCDEIEEILGEPRRLECNVCGAVLEPVADLEDVKSLKVSFESVFGGRFDPGDRFEVTPEGVAVLVGQEG